MTDNNEQETKRPLSLGRPGGGRLELRKPIETGQVRQSFPHGRSKTVQVEVRRKRAVTPGQPEKPETQEPGTKPAASAAAQPQAGGKRAPMVMPRGLTPSEQAARQRALKGAILADEEARKQAVLDADRIREEEANRSEADRRRREDEARRRQEEEEAKRKAEEEARQRLEAEGKRKAEEDKRREMAERAGKAAAAKVAALSAAGKVKIEEEPEEDLPKRGKTEARKPTLVPRRDEPRRRTTGKLTVSRVLNQGDEERMRSLASVRRAREKQRAHQLQALQEPTKIVRDVVVPETITVQELANRMAERGADVIKALMRMGVMATINQAIDADTAELVVAADDGIKEQTVEAIRHARAAKVPIIVAINKVDKFDANPDKVRQELLQHEIVVEKLSGDVLDIEVSALKKTGLEKLEEAILLQAEILDLKANPDRLAEGVVIEAKLERGRGAVATVLIKRGTLKVGDIFVTGSEWGRVRALLDDRGATISSAGPAMPVEVQGLNGVPLAGDDFTVAADEGQARDIAAFRQRRRREQQAAQGARGTLEQMFSQIAAGAAKELAVVVKSDVQGSLEAIVGSLEKLSSDEVKLRVLHSAVGGITESDVTLAKASAAVIVGFNVRANPQARDMARRDGVEIRYYSIIYDVIDDMKKALGGMLAPTLRERFLGNATIREVFTVTKAGKVAGCMVTEGTVRRGARVRLLRDNVVVHEGSLKTLRRFKDEVREVKEGYECGMAFENYQDIQVGDVIECFEMEEVARATA